MEDRFRSSERKIPEGKTEHEEDSESQELFLKNLDSDDFRKYLIPILFKLLPSIEKGCVSTLSTNTYNNYPKSGRDNTETIILTHLKLSMQIS